MTSKLKYIIVTVALTLAACHDKAVVAPDKISDREIGFVVREDKTRADIVTIDELENIGVYGYFTGYERWGWISENNPSVLKPDYFCNTKLTKEHNWTYSPIRYWPMEPAKRLSFFAYAPWSDGSQTIGTGTGAIVPYPLVVSETGTPALKYTVPENIKEQIDLLRGSVIDKNIESPQVDFIMNHALAAITFSVRYATEAESLKGYDLNVTGITISGIYGTGILDLATGKWSFDTSEDPIDEYILQAGAVFDEIVPASVETPHLKTGTNVSVQLLTANAGMFMLIPQELSRGSLTFFLDFIATADSNITPTYVSFALSDIFDSWQAGKHYHYELLIKGDFITVETSVRSVWQKAGNESSGSVII